MQGFVGEGGVRLTSSQSVALDLARGIAAQLVLVGHVVTAVNLNHPKLLFQDLGVAVFFILSGMLVTMSVTSKPASYGFVDYLIDRGARIFVPYVPAVLFIVAIGAAFRLSGPIDLGTIVGNMLMLEDYPLWRFTAWFPQIERVGSGRPLWSVAMEWWIYMGAAALYFSRRLPAWSLILVVPGLFVVGFNIVIGTLGLVWLAGAAIVAILPRLSRHAPWLAIAILLAALAAYRLILAQGNFYELQFTLIMVALLIATLMAVEDWRWLEPLTGIAAFLAGISYTLYLTHYTVMQVFSKAIVTGWTRVIVVTIVANVVATLMWLAFERHHRAVARWARSRLPVSAGAGR